MCAIKGLAATKLKMDMSEQLRPWLERRVLAFGSELLTLQESPPMLIRIWKIWRGKWGPQAYNWQVFPLWHDVDQRAKGLEFSF